MKKLSKMQRAARGQPCMIRVPNGIHLPDPENATSVLCHAPFPDRGGMRDNDLYAAIGCNRCHDFMDGRLGRNPPDSMYAATLWLAGIRDTHTLFVKLGLIVLT